MTTPDAGAPSGSPATIPRKPHEPWWPIPPAPVRPSVAHDYGVSLFWSLVDRIGGTVQTITLREKLVRCIREGAFAEAYLLALQHDYQLGHSIDFPLPPPGKTRDELMVEAQNRAARRLPSPPCDNPPTPPAAGEHWRASQD
jgi:hypothetical protein